MKKILPLLSFLFCWASLADAQTLRYCQVLDTKTNQTTSANGAISEFKPQNIRGLSGIATASNDSGTSPTLDLKIQTCRTTATSSCQDFITFDQCTTGSCYGGDGVQGADINRDTVNWWRYFRAVSTLGGTSPQYDYTVELCFDGTS